ncbi:hypothetical protein VHEMI07927 [[Torrubiella] hemipterigena]|uniref:AB hydrolase-1 domain-containing protein n=1 Tax=[Torrubiella] hemipterigena TaxID=1531966 RepID=A0A0A1T534_9HYPO|nr:hypothetical protein VHEMI07927 [[Torrubiella] hemipterigena]
MSALPIEQLLLPTPSGNLEVLTCTPPSSKTNQAPILCLHGAYCSASDYRNFLSYFASHGYPSYSLSIRGHGQSWSQSWLTKNLFTTLDDYVADITAALNVIAGRHPNKSPPILMGHSFGGGQLQYLLGQLGSGRLPSRDIAGLVLLAAAPLSGGGKEIMANWELVEAGPEGYKHIWSPRAQLHTADQVRAAFFHDKTENKVIDYWLEKCKTPLEGIRIGLSVMWPFATAEDVLSGLCGLESKPKRKVLCVTGDRDRLTPPSMAEENAKAYAEALTKQGHSEVSGETICNTVVAECAHHLAMDVGWERCAETIINWIEGNNI